MARKYLLAIDGGGIRGIIPATALVAFEDQTGRPAREVFDFLAGISTGAIIAGALAAGVRAEAIMHLYQERAGEVFDQSRWTKLRRIVLGYMYSPHRLRAVLAEVLGVEAERPLNAFAADLVVDAGGRGSRAPAWLEALGYDRPVEEKVSIDLAYTTRIDRRRPDDLPGAKFAVVQPTPPHQMRGGVLLRLEGGRWIASLGGWLGDHAPPDEAGFLAFARSLPAPDLYAVIRQAAPLGEAVVHKFPANLRRRYERLARVPAGDLALGDALCSFNPVYAQGMASSALQAAVLGACLREGRGEDAGLPRRFYWRAAQVIDPPWQMAAGADFAYPAVTGPKPAGTDLVNRYLGLVLRAAVVDGAVCRALVEVTNLLAPPRALFAPRLVWRVARAVLGRRLARGAPGGDRAG